MPSSLGEVLDFSQEPLPNTAPCGVAEAGAPASHVGREGPGPQRRERPRVPGSVLPGRRRAAGCPSPGLVRLSVRCVRKGSEPAFSPRHCPSALLGAASPLGVLSKALVSPPSTALAARPSPHRRRAWALTPRGCRAQSPLRCGRRDSAWALCSVCRTCPDARLLTSTGSHLSVLCLPRPPRQICIVPLLLTEGLAQDGPRRCCISSPPRCTALARSVPRKQVPVSAFSAGLSLQHTRDRGGARLGAAALVPVRAVCAPAWGPWSPPASRTRPCFAYV